MRPINQMQPTAIEALDRLREGNARFVSGANSHSQQSWHPGIIEGQRPFAVILGCSDSRAPAELVFDQGLGELFVIRVAGNIVAPSGVGSVEFAVAQFETPLVVVMGHTRCGAVTATLNAIENKDSSASRNIRSITDRIAPQLQALVRFVKGANIERPVLLREAVRANIVASTSQLRHGSALLESLVQTKKLLIVGAEYELESGKVDFFELGAADGSLLD